MQKLFARPTVAPALIAFGVTLTFIGYGYLHHGSFQYVPQTGPPEIISPATHPLAYWLGSAGMFVVGLVLLVLSAYAVVCFSRAYRAGEVTLQRRTNPRGIAIIGIAFILIFFAMIAQQCSRR